jgi:predicted nucleotidyltransferase
MSEKEQNTNTKTNIRKSMKDHTCKKKIKKYRKLSSKGIRVLTEQCVNMYMTNCLIYVPKSYCNRALHYENRFDFSLSPKQSEFFSE